MFYECAISPEALFEIAIDRRNYRDFIKGFSTGGNFLYSELPKLKRNKKQLLGLLNANHSELQKKRLEDLIIFLKNNKVSRVYDYVGDMSWSDNISAVNRIEQFDHVVSSTPCDNLDVTNIDDFFGLNYARQKIVARIAEDMISIISRLLKTSEHIIIVDPYFSDKQSGFAPIFPDTCYHLTHYWPAAADIPVASDNPAHYADAIRYNARTPLQGSLLPLTRLVWA